MLSRFFWATISGLFVGRRGETQPGRHYVVGAAELTRSLHGKVAIGFEQVTHLTQWKKKQKSPAILERRSTATRTNTAGFSTRTPAGLNCAQCQRAPSPAAASSWAGCEKWPVWFAFSIHFHPARNKVCRMKRNPCCELDLGGSSAWVYMR